MPAIATVPIPDNDWLNRVLANIELYDWLVFTSPSGVRIFFDDMVRAGVDCRRLAGRIAALGQGTAAELRKHGYIADLVPDEATGEALGAALAVLAKPESKILIPRARIGNKALVEALSAFNVDDVPTYDTVSLSNDLVDIAAQFEQGRIFCVAFTSSSGVRAFAEANPNLDFSSVQAACIGEKTRATAEGLGMRTWVADEASMDSLCALIMEQFEITKQNGGL